MLVHPFYHSHNSGLITFNMVQWNDLPQEMLTFVMASYSGVYVTIVSFFSVLFTYRYWIMINSRRYLEFFKSCKVIFLIFYALTFGLLCTGIVIYCGDIDKVAMEYFRKPLMDNYGLEVENVSGYAIVAYEGPFAEAKFWKTLRFKSFMLTHSIVMMLVIQFIVMAFYGSRMHFRMNEMLNMTSTPNRRLQKQFFRCLVLQVVPPTITFYIPALIILTVPFFNFQFDLPTGLIVCSFSIYPAIDSCIVMCIVSEYRKAIKMQRVYSNTSVSMSDSEDLTQRGGLAPDCFNFVPRTYKKKKRDEKNSKIAQSSSTRNHGKEIGTTFEVNEQTSTECLTIKRKELSGSQKTC
ncbi:unnamed protein product [Caenorhabditis sp. 36 PRJEB53466]|nr:unnamed protein product [Caenorhabditis sp. 36 PRJEB53466]